MDDLIYWKLAGILVLIVGNAFFVASEIALTSARRSRIRQLADEGNSAAKVVEVLHAEPERFYSVTQIGITIMSLILGAIGIVTVTSIFDPLFANLEDVVTLSDPAHNIASTAAQVVAFLLISGLHIVGGELAPKVFAFHQAERVSLAVSRVINTMYRSMYWFIVGLNKTSDGLLWLFGQRDFAGPSGGHFSISEEELRTILVASETEGILDPEETAMIKGVFDLGNRKAYNVMVPRPRVTGIPRTATIADVLSIFASDRHHRYPIYDNNIDQIVGVLPVKEVLNAIHAGGQTSFTHTVDGMMLPPLRVPESMTLDKLLSVLKRESHQMAIVIDEFSGTSGIVTLEDVLEEIVGEYGDEYSAPSKTKIVENTTEGRLVVEGAMDLADLSTALQGYDFPAGDFTTVAGLVIDYLGHLPSPGDAVNLAHLTLTVDTVDGTTIDRVSVRHEVGTESSDAPAEEQE